jgi:hypothetical protein
MFYVYLLKSPEHRMIYVGYTEDLKRRYAEHQKLPRHNGWKLIYYEAYLNEDDARLRVELGALERANPTQSGTLQDLEWAGRLLAFCIMSLRVIVRGQPKVFCTGGEGKPSANSAKYSRGQ